MRLADVRIRSGLCVGCRAARATRIVAIAWSDMPRGECFHAARYCEACAEQTARAERTLNAGQPIANRKRVTVAPMVAR